MTVEGAKEAGYEALQDEEKNVRTAVFWKSKRCILIFSVVCFLTAITLSFARNYTFGKHQPKGCEADYWKRSCRLHRGSKHHYRNFLARAGLLMPPAIHVKLTEERLGRGRLLVVGDVHGCKDELLSLLDKANYTHGLDNLVLAGDLVDKGPFPIEVIAETRRLGAMSVRGNHDDSALAAFEAIRRGEKVKKKHKWVQKLSAADAHWLAQLPWTISVPSHSVIVVHAGVVPEVALEDQLLVDLYRMRELAPGDDTKWHGLEANPTRHQGVPWAQVWGGPQHIVFGHDHQRGLQDETYATGVDTGLAYGDYLTGVLFPNLEELAERKARWQNSTEGVTLQMLGAEIIQVKAKKKYYGGEWDLDED